MTEDEVFERLLVTVREMGGQRAFAVRAGVTPSYINDVVNKRRLMSDRILAVIGVERRTTVEYVLRADETPNNDRQQHRTTAA